MQINVGRFDKIGRLALGIGAIVVGWYFGSWFGIIGLVLIFTALFNFCPIYRLLGINTCSIKK